MFGRFVVSQTIVRQVLPNKIESNKKGESPNLIEFNI